MNGRTQQFKVGLFVIFTVILLIGLLVFVMQSRLGGTKDPYYIYFEENVKGIGMGAAVNFKGINVGSVTDARFSRGRTEVQIGVDTSRAVIQEVTTAQIDRAWVTGQATVELEGYDPNARILPPMGVIKARQSMTARVAGTLPEVMEQAALMMEDVKKSSEAFRALMTGEDETSLRALVAATREAVQVLRAQLEGLGKEGSGVMAATNDLLRKEGPVLSQVLARSGETLGTITEAAKRFEQVLGNPSTGGSVSELVTDLRKTAQSLSLSAAEFQGTLGGSQDGIRRGLIELENALREVRDLARDLRSAPSSLVFGRASRERAIPDAPPVREGR